MAIEYYTLAIDAGMILAYKGQYDTYKHLKLQIIKP